MSPIAAAGPPAALTERLRGLLDDFVAAYAGTEPEGLLRAVGDHLDEPLKVAIAGRVKAGKSTLLNALLGERLAATDAAECTRVITWYTHGPASRVWAYPWEGEPWQLRFYRRAGQTEIDLGGHRAEDLRRIVIETPNSRLARLTLIDTPGIASLSRHLSARAVEFVTDPQERGADAVLYLLRHLHASDVDFLEAFHDEQFAGTTPVNTIGVLSRADEVGAGRGDALQLAQRIAADYRRDPRVRALTQTVVAVSGLLGEAGAMLREREYAALRDIAKAPAGAVEMVLLSADRFTVDGAPLPVTAEVRRELLAQLGLFGVRLSVALVRQGTVTDAQGLAVELRRRSGLDELRTVLLEQFTERADLLKAYAALRTLEAVLAASPAAAADRLGARVEAVLVGAHELTELRLLNDLRTGVVELADEARLDDAEALLGAAGRAVRSRLRLPPEAAAEEVHSAAVAALRRWRRFGESPVTGPAERRVAAVVRRTCEGLLVSATPGTPRGW